MPSALDSYLTPNLTLLQPTHVNMSAMSDLEALQVLLQSGVLSQQDASKAIGKIILKRKASEAKEKKESKKKRVVAAADEDVPVKIEHMRIAPAAAASSSSAVPKKIIVVFRVPFIHMDTGRQADVYFPIRYKDQAEYDYDLNFGDEDLVDDQEDDPEYMAYYNEQKERQDHTSKVQAATTAFLAKHEEWEEDYSDGSNGVQSEEPDLGQVVRVYCKEPGSAHPDRRNQVLPTGELI